MSLLAERSLWPLWAARLLEQTAHWSFFALLLAAVWAGTQDPAVTGWTVAIRFAPRALAAVVPFGGRLRGGWVLLVVLLLLAAAIGGWFALVAWLPAPVMGPMGAIGAAALLGSIAAASGLAWRTLVDQSVDRRQLGLAALLGATVERTGMVGGGIVAALVVVNGPGSPAGLPLLAVASLFTAAAMATAVAGLVARRRVAPPVAPPARPAAAAHPRTFYLVATFGIGAVAGATLAALPAYASGLGSVAHPGLLLAAVGVGLLAGPLPVSRLLLRLSPALIVGATSGVVAMALLVTFLLPNLLVAAVALLVLGTALATQDALRAIALRRLVAPIGYGAAVRRSALALGVGQVVGALAVALASPVFEPAGIVMFVAVGQLVLIGLAAVAGGVREALRPGGLSTLAVKSVVHKLSWEANPPATAADFGAAEPRVRRLAGWIGRRVELERVTARLPVSGREYHVVRPRESSRERLFEAGRADPDKQMPFWAKVWPSGVALADVVIERRDEVSGRQVLELGAGLGVTACAVLEAGGSLVTADYSALPLAHCRLSTLVNTGRAPRATCFNWRYDSEVSAALRRPGFGDGFPLILAADVLYEGRDAAPLLNVIERLLPPDGELWLAEPVRRTAQRFLDSAAALGWDIESRQVAAEWPDATNGPVNLHVLRRSAEPDSIVSDLGGWRI